ncbi:hypothetical protein BC829DRAFT_422688 [Chytridium lagenaria]|nr:hypothetical protein BC829DRAFT_422688 [Chytridium lagenaria]
MAGTGLLNSEDIAQLRMSSLSEKTMGKQEVIGLRFSIMDLDEKSIAKLHRAYLRASNLSQWPLQRDGRRKFEKWLSRFWQRSNDFKDVTNTSARNLSSVTSWQSCSVPDADTTAYSLLAVVPSHLRSDDDIVSSNFMETSATGSTSILKTFPARNAPMQTRTINMDQFDNEATTLLNVIFGHTLSDQEVFRMVWVLGDMFTGKHRVNFTPFIHPSTSPIPPNIQQDRDQWYHQAYANILLIPEPFLNLLFSSFVDASSRQPMNMDRFQHEAVTLVNVIFGHSLSERKVWEMVVVIGEMFQETYQPQRVYAYVDTDGVTQDGERVFNEVTTDATLNGEEGVEKDEKRVGGLFGYGLKVLGNISGWMMRLVGL